MSVPAGWSLPGGRLSALLLGALAGVSCTTLEDRIVEPRSLAAGLPDATRQQIEASAGIVRNAVTTAEGLHIGYARVPAGQRGLYYQYERVGTGGRFQLRLLGPLQPEPARGSIVLIHGWGGDAGTMLPWGLALAEHGYETVAADLRNHGGSDRAPAGFGTREARDVALLVDALQTEGGLPPPLYLAGVSYGAATALFAEPLLRDRVRGIVALAPFANAADSVHGMVAAVTGSRSQGLRAGARLAFARRHYDRDRVARAVAGAGRRLDLDLQAVDVADAVSTSQTCTVLLHGDQDRVIPVTDARRLAAAGSGSVQYVEVAGEGHLSLPLRIDWLAAPIVAWLEELRPGASCAPFGLPPWPD